MKKMKGLALIFGLVATAGCQGFPLNFSARDQVDSAEPDMSSYFVQRMDDGRRHLAARRPAAALTAFRQASYHPDHAGEAYNGMAIAYDQLGRYDLAERFFAQAVSASPHDERFARNATRFEATMLARQEVEDAVQWATSTSPTQISALDEATNFSQVAQVLDAELAPPAEGRLRRITAREVAITSRDDWTRRVADAETERPAVLHIGDRRGEMELLADAAVKYPVRIELASVRAGSDQSSNSEQSESGRSRFADARGSVRVTVSGPVRRTVRPEYPITVRLDPPS